METILSNMICGGESHAAFADSFIANKFQGERFIPTKTTMMLSTGMTTRTMTTIIRYATTNLVVLFFFGREEGGGDFNDNYNDNDN